VLDEHHGLLGVLSERDLVRALSLHGPSAIALTCGSMIDGVPATCSPQDSIRDVMLLMTRRRARHIPVLVDGAIVGIISIGDLVKGQLDDLELEVGVLRDYSRMRGFLPQ